MCEFSEIAGGRKEAGMSRDSAHHERVLIVHLALDHAISDLLAIRGRHDLPFNLFCRIEERGAHPESIKNIELTKILHRGGRDLLQSFAQKDEPDVAVLSFGARIGGKRD